jgi:hypothetical protein
LLTDFVRLSQVACNDRMAPGNEMAKGWRPWQFSLRVVMLITLVLASFFGGWRANDWHREKNQLRWHQQYDGTGRSQSWETE